MPAAARKNKSFGAHASSCVQNESLGAPASSCMQKKSLGLVPEALAT